MNDQKILILNLVDVLDEKIQAYFEKMNIELITRTEFSEELKLDYILVDDISAVKEVSKDFNTIQNQIEIICCGDVKEVKEYLLSNGRLIINSHFVETEIGQYILNKFFKKNYNIHLDESFSSSFDNIKDFKVINHLTTGTVIDNLSIDVFDKGFNLISLRSYLDHIIYYLIYLKQSGYASIPLEFEYGHNEEFLAINVNASVNNFIAEYMINSFGNLNSSNPMDYLLSVAQKSCDYLDITYIEDPGKICITAFYAKNKSDHFKGISFNNVKTSAQIIAQLDKKIKNYIPNDDSIKKYDELADSLEEKNLPGGLLETKISSDPNSIINKDNEKTDEMISFIVEAFKTENPSLDIGSFKIEDLNQKLKDFPNQEFVENLTDKDKEALVSRVQKNDQIQTILEEEKVIREELNQDADFKNKLQAAMTEEVSERVTKHLDANILNNILAKEIPTFDSDDPFATPAIAARNIAAEAFDHFDNVFDAQAFAIAMAKNAQDKYSDPTDAESFARNLVEELDIKFPNSFDKDVLEEVIIKQVKHEKELSPEDLGLKMGHKALEKFQNFDDIESFALNLLNSSSEQFSSPEESKSFINSFVNSIGDQFGTEEEKLDFSEKLTDIALGKELNFEIPSRPDFGSDDPFALPKMDFANPKEAAEEIVKNAVDESSDIKELQSFVMNEILENEGSFNSKEDIEAFTSSIIDGLVDKFDNEDQKNDFAKTIEKLVSADSKIPKLENDPFASVVKGQKETIDQTLKIGGADDSEEAQTLVKGGKKEADDFIQKISGLKEEDESSFVTTFSNSFEDGNQKGLFKFKSGSPEERKKDLNWFVKSTLDNSPSLKEMDLKIKAYVHKNAPDRINNALEDYAFNAGISVDSLSDDQLSDFKMNELPSVMNNLLEDDQSIYEFKMDLENVKPEIVSLSATQTPEDQFEMRFKSKLENKLSELNNVQKIDNKFVVDDSQLSDEKIQSVIKDTMKESFDEEFKFSTASKEDIEAKEKQLVKNLASTLQMEEKDVQSIVKGAADKVKDEEDRAVAQRLNENKQENLDGNKSRIEAELISKLKNTENENKKLKNNISALELKLKADKESAAKLKDIQEKSMQEAKETHHIESLKENSNPDDSSRIVLAPTMSEAEQKKLIDDLKDGRPLNLGEVEKLQRALMKEQEMIAATKKAEANSKKSEIENQKLSMNFKSELDRATKALKAKDLVLDKAKDSMKNVVSKKEKEMLDLKKQVAELNQRLASDKSTILESQLKLISADKESLTKQLEVYRSKLENVIEKVEKDKKDDNSALIQEENRGLKGLKNQLENKLNSEIKQRRSIEDRYQKSKEFEGKARNELAKLQSSLKLSQGQLKVLQTQNENLLKNASNAINNSSSDRELNLLKEQNTKLQEKMQLMIKKLNEAPKEVSKPDSEKTNSVELQKQKVQIEKSEKEINLLKDQNSKLQEMIEKLKKENQDVSIKDADPEKLAAVIAQKDEKAESAAVKEVEVLKSQNEELQGKLQAMAQKLKQAVESEAKPDENKSTNEQRLEQSIKAMNVELTKAKAEAAEKKKVEMKAKTEITGLKNQITKLKKDLQKAEESAKKSGGKKKAA